MPSYSIGFCVARTRNGGASGCVDALDRHLPLLHRLEQRRLRLRWGAVDLVGEEEVGEDRAGPELEVGLALVVDRGAGHVGGHQVGRELDAREADARHLREGAGHQRLRQAREVLDQDVAVGEDPEQHELERLALADDRALDLVEDVVRAAGELLDVHSDSSRSTMRRRRCGGCAGGVPVGRRGPVVARELPELRAEHLLAVLEAQPARGEADADDLAHDRPQADMRVERRGVRHRQLALEPVELGRALGLGRVAVERLGERRALLERKGLTRREHDVEAPPARRRTRMKTSSSSSNQPGASSRAKRSTPDRITARKSQAPKQPPHAARAASGSSSARRPARASIASAFIPSSISSRLNLARS